MYLTLCESEVKATAKKFQRYGSSNLISRQFTLYNSFILGIYTGCRLPAVHTVHYAQPSLNFLPAMPVEFERKFKSSFLVPLLCSSDADFVCQIVPVRQCELAGVTFSVPFKFLMPFERHQI